MPLEGALTGSCVLIVRECDERDRLVFTCGSGLRLFVADADYVLVSNGRRSMSGVASRHVSRHSYWLEDQLREIV